MPSLTVAENLVGGVYGGVGASNRMRIRPRDGHWCAAEQLEAHGATWLRTKDLVKDHDLASHQALEVVKALVRGPKLLALDEPMSALNGVQVQWLMERTGQFVSEGRTIVYISHRAPEVRSLCNVATVFHEGRDVTVVNRKDVDDDEMFTLIVGERRSRLQSLAAGACAATTARVATVGFQSASVGPATASGPSLLEVKDLVTRHAARAPMSFTAAGGEILGLAGLQGHGQGELLKALFGVGKARAGDTVVNGRTVAIRSPRDAIRAGMGLALMGIPVL